jgi:hypothetical protein
LSRAWPSDPITYISGIIRDWFLVCFVAISAVARYLEIIGDLASDEALRLVAGEA